ncbi:hypothetical protein FQA39_LY12784 [Lamprigera yunnana]|nr:hypothetical protein FQA39_LY12784 [Lamprigera yunnana]
MAEIKLDQVEAIGITNQRETAVRTAKYCEKMDQATVDLIRNKTGLILNPYFSGTKVKWILENVKGARKLADEDFGVPRSMLPEIKSCSEEYGKTYPGLVSKSDHNEVPITSSIGDQQSALLVNFVLTKNDMLVKLMMIVEFMLFHHLQDRGTKREHIVRATLEAIAYQANDVVSAMAKDLKKPLTILKVDGGASNNKFMMQFQADISQAKVLKPKNVETTAMGAGYLAGLAVGY